MTEAGHRLDQGGLYRCCVSFWHLLKEDELAKYSSVTCPHCKAMLSKDGNNVWAWTEDGGRIGDKA
jgi:hypothetical protein